MKLYYAPGACSLAPHIVLREAGTPFELIRVDLATHTFGDGRDYYTINPKGQVPVLELDDGSCLTEGPIISQYIADRAEARELMPAPGTMERYRVMEWQSYITSELHKSFSALFGKALDAAGKKVFADALLQKLGWVTEQIGERKYLTGDAFTAADAYLFVVASWTQYVGLDISGLPKLQAYLGRVAERPAVAGALRAEGLLK